ncbi:uncharacterized protein L199_005067 [Kwoniella botswanensis]|uniref:uncharacterized protein n=1 Tax=Kwoniella botswanensis TaxID=1268659 RepID=UPI00315E0292
MESHFYPYGKSSRKPRGRRRTDCDVDETAGESNTQTDSEETERFDEYGYPSATGYTIDEMLQRFRQWASKNGMDLNELPDARLYEMMTNHLHSKRATPTSQGDDEWELPPSDDSHPAASHDEEEKRQAAELNSYIGLPPPYERQSALSRRSTTERHPTRGVTTRVGVRKNWDYELEIEFPEETIWANSPTGGSTDIRIPPTIIVYEISRERLSAESPKDRGHPSRRSSKATFPPPPRSAAPRAPPFCHNRGEPDCWGC